MAREDEDRDAQAALEDGVEQTAEDVEREARERRGRLGDDGETFKTRMQ